MQITRYLNHYKKDKKGLTPVWFSVTANGWQYKLSTGEKILEANWESFRVTKKQPGYVNINSRLDNLYNYISGIGHRHGKALNKEQFKELLKEYRADEIFQGAAQIEDEAPLLPFLS